MKKILFCLLAFYTHNSCPQLLHKIQRTPLLPMFGLGELSTGEGGVICRIKVVLQALHCEGNTLNNANPASLTELTEQRFQIDAGIMGAYQTTRNAGASKLFRHRKS